MPHIPLGSFQQKITIIFANFGTDLRAYLDREARATCPFYSKSYGEGVDQCARWPGPGKTFLPGAGSGVLSTQEN